MPPPETEEGRRGGRLLTVVFWTGVGLAPLAALLVLVGSGASALKVAAVLAILAVVLVGLSIMLRPDAMRVKAELEETILDEVDLLRSDVREDIATAARATHKAFSEKLHALYDNLEAVRGQVEVVRGQVEAVRGLSQERAEARPAASVGRSAPVPPSSAAMGTAMVGGGVVRHTETVRETTRQTIVDPHAEPERGGTVYGAGTVYAPRGAEPATPAAAPSGRRESAWSDPEGGREAGREAGRERDSGHDSGRDREPGRGWESARGWQAERGWEAARAWETERGWESDRGRDTDPGRSRDEARFDHERTGERSERGDRSERGRASDADRVRGSESGRRAAPEESWTEQRLRARLEESGALSRSLDPDSGGLRIPAQRSSDIVGGSGSSRASEPDDEPHWSGLRAAGDRWAAVRSDDRGRELRMGERRAEVHSDASGTELRIEDRWAAVRREDARRSAESDRAETRRERDEDWFTGSRSTGRRAAPEEDAPSPWSQPSRDRHGSTPALPAGGEPVPSWATGWSGESPSRRHREREPIGREPLGREPIGRDREREPIGREPIGREPWESVGREPRESVGREPRERDRDRERESVGRDREREPIGRDRDRDREPAEREPRAARRRRAADDDDRWEREPTDPGRAAARPRRLDFELTDDRWR